MTVDARILLAMRRAASASVSGADLAQDLAISRAAVWAHIEELRRLGYEIEASPHRGYRLVGSPDRLHADDLLARLGQDVVVGRDIRVFHETGSTNDVVERLARDGVKEGVVVFAEAQSAGRGRLGRSWMSPAGRGLWFSVLLRPALHPQAATRLTIAAATSLVRAIGAETGLAPQIKWPNDLLLDGRKVAGILTELHAELDGIKSVVLGIGVDVNLTAADLPPELKSRATSLRLELGRTVDRPALAARILRELDADYARLKAGRFADIAQEWERVSVTLGRAVAIGIGDRQVRGRAEALDPDGALLVRTQHGRLERVTGGDVTLETR
jgi:BirA family biotin operon repressor/biotin-[acetyl-CoA-carboxylase] ligase